MQRASTVAQALSTFAWAIWTGIVARRNLVFGLLTGTVGTLASLTVLSPFSNPTYLLWWLPALIASVFVFRRGYWQLVVLTVAPLVFSLAILGPAAPLAPLSTYTRIFPASSLAADVITWYTSPGVLWGATRADDFLGASAVAVLGALFSLFILWTRMAVGLPSIQSKLPA